METMGRWQQESLSLPRCTHLFVLIATSHVDTNMAHRVLNSSTQENAHLTKQKRAGPRGGIELVGLTWV